MSWCSRFRVASTSSRSGWVALSRSPPRFGQPTGTRVIISQAIVALGASATVPGLVRLLDASEQAVRDGVAQLCGRGLAWDSSGTLCLPHRLEAHWLAEIGGGRPVATIAGSVVAGNLRVALGGFGAATDGLRKPELVARLSELMTDLPLMAKVIAGLPKRGCCVARSWDRRER